jgi:ribonuclease D
MVEEVLGYRLAKEHSAADWSMRPLTQEMLRYAALDVEVLIDLRDALAAQLEEQGKAEWARQEFAAIAAAPPQVPRPDPWRRTSGIHKVRTRRGLAVVRELWETRDEIAREMDVSPRRVLTDQAIVDASRTLPATRPELDAIGGFLARNARRHGGTWMAAVRRARSADEPQLPEITGASVAGPPPPSRWPDRDPAAAARLAAARKAVNAIAEERRLPVENLLPPDAVRRLAWEPPDPLAADALADTLTSLGARPWQAELTAAQLAEALAAAGNAAPGERAPRKTAEDADHENATTGTGASDAGKGIAGGST